MPADDLEQERKAMSAAAAKRLFAFVKNTGLPAQVCLDIGIILGRLSLLEGSDWLTEVPDAGD